MPMDPLSLDYLPKSPTGIQGLDEITDGGFPKGRPTLICGGPGSGKTLLGLSFLLNGARLFGEKGVLLTFEQSVRELSQDIASLGFDLPAMIAENLVIVDHVHLERNEVEETGEYDLEALFIRLADAIDSIGATRVVLDTIEALFAGLSNESILRGELRRLFRWLKARGLTAVVTAERGEAELTRHGLEEYVSDAVILLDHRVQDQISTRRLRIVKYRGSSHGTNEYPFLIDQTGISVLPVTSLGLQHGASAERISSGVDFLDAMLGGRGFYRGSTVFVSGGAGSGKTSLAAKYAEAACARGERCIYFMFEESPQQLLRNMRSIGIDLQPWLERGLLKFHADRPSRFGLESHLAAMYASIRAFSPSSVVVDPVTNLIAVGTILDVRAMLTRIIDDLKNQGVTAFFTSLEEVDGESDMGVSSLMDTWIALRTETRGRERHRGLTVIKSRGMAHSNREEEFVLSDTGVNLAARDAETMLGAGR